MSNKSDKIKIKMMKGARGQLRAALDTMDTAIMLAEKIQRGDVMVEDYGRHMDAVLVLIDNAKQLTKTITEVYLDIEKNRG